ncbi:MAG: hypothetical protein PHE55_20370 [Methylococcaceae bacterium]|nr:hypothetical protein [Methylococcaceae bacterium]
MKCVERGFNKRLIWLAITFILTLLLSCSLKPEDEIVGKWNEADSTAIMEFFKDGTFTVAIQGMSVAGNYKFLDKDRIRIDLGGQGALKGPLVAKFSISGNELTWTMPGGKPSIYRRENTSQSDQDSDRQRAQSERSRMDPLTKEAQKTAEQTVFERLQQCGDSWYLKRDDQGNAYGEIKSPSVKVDSENVTDVDKANGIEWKGRMLVVAKMYRTINKSNGASQSNWEDGASGVQFFYGQAFGGLDPSGKARWISFGRQNGEWVFDRDPTWMGMWGGLPEKRSFNCDEIAPEQSRSAAITSPSNSSPPPTATIPLSLQFWPLFCGFTACG